MNKNKKKKRGEHLRQVATSALEYYGYDYNVNILRENGYKPIGITSMYCDITHIFRGSEEANRCFQDLDVDKKLIDGYYYGLGDFHEAQEKYKQGMGRYPEVIWLIDMKD